MNFFDYSKQLPAGEVPGVPLFSHFLPLYRKAEELGIVAEVNASDMAGGIAITVKKVITDLSSTTLFYEMDPEHNAWHVNTAVLKDDLGREVALRGEAQGILEFFPLEDGAKVVTLHVSECYKTTPGFFRILIPFFGLRDRELGFPEDVERKWNAWQEEWAGDLMEKVRQNPMMMQNIARGSWSITFPVDLEPRGKGTFTREIHRTFTFGDVELLVKRLRAGVIHWLLEYDITDSGREKLWREWRLHQWELIRACATREEFIEAQKREFHEDMFILANFDFNLHGGGEDVTGGIFVRDGNHAYYTFKPLETSDDLRISVTKMMEYCPSGGLTIPLDAAGREVDVPLALPILDGAGTVRVRNLRHIPYEARKDIVSLELAFRDGKGAPLSLEVRNAVLEDDDGETLALHKTREAEDGFRSLEFDVPGATPKGLSLKIFSLDLLFEPPLEMAI